jgi:hypothetical protein
MNMSDEQMRVAAERMKSMNPDTMRAQAQALRSMDPNMVRRSNPAMANFTDQQIKDAADQMEQMASNPFMMQQAAEEMVIDYFNESSSFFPSRVFDCSLKLKFVFFVRRIL